MGYGRFVEIDSERISSESNKTKSKLIFGKLGCK